MKAIAVFVGHGHLQGVYTDISNVAKYMKSVFDQYLLESSEKVYTHIKLYYDHVRVVHSCGSMSYTFKSFELDSTEPEFIDVTNYVVPLLIPILDTYDWGYEDCRK